MRLRKQRKGRRTEVKAYKGGGGEREGGENKGRGGEKGGKENKGRDGEEGGQVEIYHLRNE